MDANIEEKNLMAEDKKHSITKIFQVGKTEFIIKAISNESQIKNYDIDLKIIASLPESSNNLTRSATTATANREEAVDWHCGSWCINCNCDTQCNCDDQSQCGCDDYDPCSDCGCDSRCGNFV